MMLNISTLYRALIRMLESNLTNLEGIKSNNMLRTIVTTGLSCIGGGVCVFLFIFVCLNCNSNGMGVMSSHGYNVFSWRLHF